MPGRTTRSRAKAAEVEGVSSAASVASEPDAQPPPAKRPKTQKNKKPAAQTSRKKGRLSVLPTLPLDVLFEIFGHLGPPDLLHLARTTKSFRNMLMSRQSAFLWKEVYDAVDEIDNFPCPDDVSLPKWINLVYGGPFCDETGCSGRANKVLWNAQRRLCKNCQDSLLISADSVWDILEDEVMLLIDNMAETVPRDLVYRSGRPRIMYLRADVEAIGDEIRTLAKDWNYSMSSMSYPPRKGSPEWETAFAAFKARRKHLCAARHTHAEQCQLKEEIRASLRGNELEGIKDARFHDVKQRLMDMGFDAADAGAHAIRVHKEVKQAKPLTDRVWTRIGPLLRAETERIRDERLETERRQRMTSRIIYAWRRYERVTLSSVASSTVSFAPRHDVIFKLPRIAAYLTEDAVRSSAEERNACATAFADLDVLAFVDDWILRRQAALRAKLPEAWPRASSTDEEIEAHWPAPIVNPMADHYAQLADLDLAVYAFKCAAPMCKDGNRVFYGLDILAHDCVNHIEQDPSGYIPNPDGLAQLPDSALSPSPLHEHHTAALRVVQLLDLDPAKARPVDLDRADKFFTAEARDSHPEGRPFMTWRQAVHAGATWCKLDTVRLVTDREQTYIEKHHDVFGTGVLHGIDEDPDWACARCAVDSPQGIPDDEVSRWTDLAHIRAHVAEVHGVADAEEGQHYFYNRSKDRLAADDNDDVFKHLPPNVDLEGAIAALDNMGGDMPPFDLLSALWPGAQGPPPWMAHLMAGLFMDDFSDSDSEGSEGSIDF